MRMAQDLIGVGILAMIGIAIVMNVAVGTNTTGWNSQMTNMQGVIIPLVLGVGFVLGIISLAMGNRGKGL
jgi:hypothetical protein